MNDFNATWLRLRASVVLAVTAAGLYAGPLSPVSGTAADREFNALEQRLQQLHDEVQKLKQANAQEEQQIQQLRVQLGETQKPASDAPQSTEAAQAQSFVAPPGEDGATPAAAENSPEVPTYIRDVRPIFMGKCVRCHNADNRIMYNWLDYKTALGDRREIKKRVWDSWRGSYYKQPMPAGNNAELHAMTEQERLMIKRWVEAGAPYGVQSAGAGPKSKTERIELGKRLFATICAACHQPSGQGIPGLFPPLAGSDFLNADKGRAIGVLLRGLQGEVVVNRRTFNNTMPPMPLSDDDIANALTFVYNSFGNSGKEVTPDDVRSIRAHQANVAATEPKPKTARSHEPSPWE